MPKGKVFQVNPEIMSSVVNYLASRPYKEVYQLLEVLVKLKAVDAAEQPAPIASSENPKAEEKPQSA